MVKEEIDIAELRNKQLEELKNQRYSDTKGDAKVVLYKLLRMRCGGLKEI